MHAWTFMDWVVVTTDLIDDVYGDWIDWCGMNIHIRRVADIKSMCSCGGGGTGVGIEVRAFLAAWLVLSASFSYSSTAPYLNCLHLDLSITRASQFVVLVSQALRLARCWSLYLFFTCAGQPHACRLELESWPQSRHFGIRSSDIRETLPRYRN